jgi:hypothetical protein
MPANHCSSSDYGIPTDIRPWQDNRPFANPHVVSDSHRCIQLEAINTIKVMEIRCHDVTGRYQTIGANCEWCDDIELGLTDFCSIPNGQHTITWISMGAHVYFRATESYRLPQCHATPVFGPNSGPFRHQRYSAAGRETMSRSDSPEQAIDKLLLLIEGEIVESPSELWQSRVAKQPRK